MQGAKKKKIGNYIMDPAEFLGAGQYGKVYKAVDRGNGTIAAVKVIDKKQSKSFSIQLTMMSTPKTP